MNIFSYIGSIPRKLVARGLVKSGYSAHYAAAFFDIWYEDIFKNKTTSLNKKVWAHRRGFFSRRIKNYGLTEDNYKDYLTDFDYLRLHPINGPYSRWIDDKLTIKYLLYPFSEYLPDYYYHICSGEILRLMDCPDGFEATIPDILALLKAKGCLAAKLISGARGQGFHKLAYIGHDFFINHQLSSQENVSELITMWQNNKNMEYILTEYISAHSTLEKISGDTPGTVRIVVIRGKDRHPEIVFSFIKFATKKSGASNAAASMICLVDENTGYFDDGITLKGDSVLDCKFHPDTNILLEGVLPNWSLIKEKIILICDHIPQVIYMGFDLIITDGGFKIIEINSHSGIFSFQYFHPVYKTEWSREFFSRFLSR